MFGFNKKDEYFYMKDIFKMYSCCKRECPSDEKYLKDIKQAIMTINAKKINSEYIKNVQDNICDLKFKEQKDYFTMKKVIKDWIEHYEELNKN